jgi:hypothetical protein
MYNERRRARRYSVSNGARIVRPDGSVVDICRMLDVSATGARLEVNIDDRLPSDFVLLLSHDGRLRRSCSLVWREGSSVGVRFNSTLMCRSV